MDWVVLRSDTRTGARKVMPGRYSTHQRAEAAAASVNDVARRRGDTHVVHRAMTLPEAQAMAKQAPSTRRSRMISARAARDEQQLRRRRAGR